MPRYQRKSNRQSWTEQQMSSAIELVQSGQCGYLKAAKQCGVPKSTLERRVKGKNKISTGTLKGLGSRVLTFPPELEKQLVDYIKNMESMLFGLTATSVRQLAFELAEKNNLPHFFNKNNKSAGWAWLRAFIQRNNLSFRVPEATSAARAMAFNRNNVNNFFDLLESVYDRQHFVPSQIYNVDETGITTVQGRQSKIIALRGRKQVGALTSAERGTLSTAVICMSATGNFIPPMIIFPRVRMKKEFLNGAPPETLAACDPSGWMNLELFETWFTHFLKHSHSSKDNPTLLVLDGHKSHTQNLAVIDKARENGVTILCIPPHCTHRMQPLDVCFMGPLSTFYSQEQSTFLRNNPGRVITIYNVADIFGKAYLKAATPLNAISGFKKTGIFPVNRYVFTDEMFAAAMPTDHPENRGNTTVVDAHGDEDAPEDEGPSAAEWSQRDVLNKTPSPPTLAMKGLLPSTSGLQNVTPKVNTPPPSTSGLQNTTATIKTPPPSTSGMQNISTKSDLPTPESQYFSPESIKPYPKAVSRNTKSTKRKTGKATILTGTPYKDELSESVERKRMKEAGKGKRNLGNLDKEAKPALKKPIKKCKKKVTNYKQIDNTSSDEDQDPECFYCGNSFSSSKKGEGWIKCIQCLRWVHDACAGAEEDDENFLCDYCRY